MQSSVSPSVETTPEVAQQQQQQQQQPLFGGAITCQLPEGWKDLSDIRPIPDNQECFQSSFVDENPVMLVVEILERQDHIEDQDAARFFFDELAERNDALQAESDVRFRVLDEPAPAASLLGDESVVSGRNTVRVCAGCGYQKVAMGRDYDNEGNSRREQQEIKSIRVDLYVLRLPVQETDLLVTISRPVDNDAPNIDTIIDESSSISISMDTRSAESAIMSRIISTFRVTDWGLFG